MKTTQLFLSVAACAALLTLGTGCKPTEPATDATPTEEACYLETTKTDGLNQTTFVYDAQHRLTRYNYYTQASGGGSSSLSNYYDFIYNSAGKISQFSLKDATGTPGSSSEIIYNANGQVLQIKQYNASGNLISQSNYEYDSNQRTSRSNSYYSSASGGTLALDSYSTYEYVSTDKKPSKVYNYQANASSSNYVYSYFYDSNDNTLKETSQPPNGNVRYMVERTFDNKKTALISFAGLGTQSQTGTNTNNGPSSIYGKNNVISEIQTSYGPSGTVTQRNVTNYTYEYDSKGRPTKQVVLPSTSTGRTNTFTYHCH